MMKKRYFFLLIFFLIRCVYPSDAVYIVNAGSDNVTVIDPLDQTVVGTISSTPGGTGWMDFFADGETAYLTSSQATNFAIIDVSTLSITSTVVLSTGNPRQTNPVFTPDNAKCLIPGDDIVHIIDTASPDSGIKLSVGVGPRFCAISPDGSVGYVPIGEDNVVSVIDMLNNSILQTIGVGTSPGQAVFSPDGTRAYVTNLGSDNISIINTSTHTVIATFAVGFTDPAGININPVAEKNQLAVCPLSFLSDPSFVAFYDISDLDAPSLTSTLTLGDSTAFASYDSNGVYLYVPDQTGDIVFVIDADNETVTTTISLPLSTQPSRAAAPTSIINYFTDSNGSWNSASSWTPNIIPSNGNLLSNNAQAQFLDIFSGPVTVTINSGVSLTSLYFDSTEAVTIDAADSQELTLSTNVTFPSTTPLISTSSTSAAHEISSPITLAGDLTFNHKSANDFTFSGVISGAQAISITSSGTVNLNGANTYSGGTTLSSGTVSLGNDTGLGSSSLTMNASTTLDLQSGIFATTPITLSGDATVNVSTGIGTLTGIIAGVGQSITKTGGGTLALSGNNTHSGGTTLSAGTISVGHNNALGSGTLTVSGSGTTLALEDTINVSNDITLSENGAVSVASGETGMLSGSLVGVGQSLTKQGAGTLTLTGNNTYSGGTSLSAGILSVGHNNALGSGALTISGAGTEVSIADGITASNDITMSENATFSVAMSETGTLAGAIGGAGQSLTKTEAGTLSLTGTNTYTGATIISEGTLALTTAGALSSSTDVTATGTLDISSASSDRTIGSLVGSGVVSLGANTLITTNNSSTTFSGNISGTGGFTKQGTGTLLINGTNDLTGTTNISEGTLTITGSISNSSTTVANGATLGGTGTVGTLTLNGTIAPGESIGTLNISGDYNPSSNSTYEVEVDANGNSDKIVVSGTANLNNQTASIFAIGSGFKGAIEYTILTASAVNGQMTLDTTTITEANFESASLFYTSSDVILRIIWSNLQNLVSTGDPGKVAQYLDSLDAAGVLSADLESVLNVLLSLNGENLENALNQLHPEPESNMKWLVFNQINSVQKSFPFFRRLHKRNLPIKEELAFAGFTEEEDIDTTSNKNPQARLFPKKKKTQPFLFKIESDEISCWFDPAYTYYNQPTQYPNDIGVHANIYAGTAGVDYIVDTLPYSDLSLLTGFAVNGSYTHYTQRTTPGKGHFASYFLGPYLSLFQDIGVFVNTSFLMGQSFYENERYIQFSTINRTAKAEYNSFNGTFDLTGGYNYFFRTVKVSPYLGFGYYFTIQEPHLEKGADSLNLDVHRLRSYIWKAQLGLSIIKSLSFESMRIDPIFKISWLYFRPRQNQPIVSAYTGQDLTFQVFGGSRIRNEFAPTLGLNVFFKNGFFIYSLVQGQYSKYEQSTNALVRLGRKF